MTGLLPANGQRVPRQSIVLTRRCATTPFASFPKNARIAAAPDSPELVKERD
jgi:hypothetical protein